MIFILNQAGRESKNYLLCLAAHLIPCYWNYSVAQIDVSLTKQVSWQRFCKPKIFTDPEIDLLKSHGSYRTFTFFSSRMHKVRKQCSVRVLL